MNEDDLTRSGTCAWQNRARTRAHAFCSKRCKLTLVAWEDWNVVATPFQHKIWNKSVPNRVHALQRVRTVWHNVLERVPQNTHKIIMSLIINS